MIKNLNQLTFQNFGSVLSERAQPVKNADKNSEVLQLSRGDSAIFRASAQTRISGGKGPAVLSVSLDGEIFEHFYLDKIALVKPGVYFGVSPFEMEATVMMAAEESPEMFPSRELDFRKTEHQLRVDGIHTFFYQEKEQGFLFAGESHPMMELTYVDQGALHSVVEGQDILLKQGELVLYGANQWHMQYADIGVAPRFITISFDISGTEITPITNRRFAAPQQVADLLQAMLREQERMDAYSDDVILAQLGMVILYLLREAEAPTGSRLRSANSVRSENEVVRRAQQYISENIRQKLSVPMVAEHVDVSASYLTVLFHKNLQISPGEYIRRVKLQESKRMIRENDLNFTEIAAALQYSTVHHFSRQFKEKFGITPTEYAKSVR